MVWSPATSVSEMRGSPPHSRRAWPTRPSMMFRQGSSTRPMSGRKYGIRMMWWKYRRGRLVGCIGQRPNRFLQVRVTPMKLWFFRVATDLS